MRRLAVLIFLGLATGCSGLPQGHYYRMSDGLRGDANPEVLKQYQQDRSICDGEGAKAALAGHETMDTVRAELVVRGCMSNRGYFVK